MIFGSVLFTGKPKSNNPTSICPTENQNANGIYHWPYTFHNFVLHHQDLNN